MEDSLSRWILKGFERFGSLVKELLLCTLLCVLLYVLLCVSSDYKKTQNIGWVRVFSIFLTRKDRVSVELAMCSLW